jgi:beta-glucanase (GH16 family)
MKLNWLFAIPIIGALNCESFGSSAAPARSADQAGPKSEGWELVWSDEFDKDGPPDPRNWKYETGFVRAKEYQWYQPDNACCQNGLLIIEGRLQQVPNPDFEANSKHWRKNRKYADFTSASLTTEGLHSWLYGRFEMRARIDTRLGLWPAFWTLGVEGPWPNRGEIDIMEYYRGMLMANAAWGSKRTGVPKWNIMRTPIEQFHDPDWSQKFHVWRMDWDEGSIRLYVDGTLLNTIELATTVNEDPESKNPFRQPHCLVLNLAIGGKNGGDPALTKFPARFEVDYVRVYQRVPGAHKSNPTQPIRHTEQHE